MLNQLWAKQKSSRAVKLLLLLVLLGGLVVIVFHKLGSPARGTITQPQNSGRATTKVIKSVASSYDGKYISFKYPAGYLEAYAPLSGNYLEVHRIYASRHSDRYITLSIVRESIVNDPGVNFRKNHPEMYSQRSVSLGGLVFLKIQNGYERTFYINHGDLVISIAAVDSVGQDVSTDQDQVLDSINWK